MHNQHEKMGKDTVAKVIDKVSDAMSYQDRRASQKSMINSDRNLAVLKNRSASDKKNYKYSLEEKGGLRGMPNQELMAQKRAIPTKNTQRDQYEKAMNRAMKKGGSNGVGVGM